MGAFPLPLRAEETAPITVSNDSRVHDLMEKAARLRSEERYQEAIEAYEAARQIDAANPKVLRNLGVLYYESKDLDKAREILMESLGVDFKDAYSHLYMGRIMLDDERIEKAIVHLQRAVHFDPSIQEAHYILGVTYYKRGDFVNGKSELERAMAMDPQDARPHVGMGSIALKQKNYNEAIESFRQALKLNPNEPEAYNGIGAAQYEQMNYEEAAWALEQALLIEPNQPVVMNNLGVTHLQLKHYDQAERIFNAVLKMKPDDRTARENLDNLNAMRHQQMFDGDTEDPFYSDSSAYGHSRVYNHQQSGGPDISSNSSTAGTLLSIGAMLLGGLAVSQSGGGGQAHSQLGSGYDDPYADSLFGFTNE